MGYRDNFFKNNKSNNGWYECNYCGAKMRKSDVTVDHITPQACGGSDDSNNLTAACRHCNSQKGAKDDIDYEAWLDEKAGFNDDLDDI